MERVLQREVTGIRRDRKRKRFHLMSRDVHQEPSDGTLGSRKLCGRLVLCKVTAESKPFFLTTNVCVPASPGSRKGILFWSVCAPPCTHS